MSENHTQEDAGQGGNLRHHPPFKFFFIVFFQSEGDREREREREREHAIGLELTNPGSH